MLESATHHKVVLKETFETIKQSEGENPQKALSDYEELMNHPEIEDDYSMQVDCLLRTVHLNMRQGFYTKALREGGTALRLINYHFPEDKRRLGFCYKELGTIYTNGFGKNSIALNYFFKAIKCEVPELNVNLYNNIGSLYKDAQLYDQALKYLERGQAIAEKDSMMMIFILENKSIVYSGMGAYEKAEQLLRKGIKMADRIAETNPAIYYIKGFILNTLAQLLHQTNRTNETCQYVDEALAIANERNYTSIIIESLKNKAVFQLAMENDLFFEELIQQAIEHTKDETLSSLQIDCLKILKQYYWDKSAYKKACLVADQILLIKHQIDETEESNSMVDLLEERESEIFLLENKNKMINRQKDELEQFAYIVAHDLKEPLRNIGGFGSLVVKKYSNILDEDGKEFLNFIIDSSTHLNSMLEDLLRYATLGNTATDIELVDPGLVIERIRYHVQNKLVETKATINFSDLIPVHVRKTHLNVIFDNLIKNAIKFKDPNRAIVIDIKNEKIKNEVIFSVRDNGKGIDAKHHDSIFQIFRRLEKDTYKGTGIGLSVCKKIVDTYHGRIWVESVVDVGSTFYFSFKESG